MNSAPKSYKDSYLPVDPDFVEIVDKAIAANKKGKVHYFDTTGNVNTCEGLLTALTKQDKGTFLEIDKTHRVRLDKIITLLGRPGPAYDTYDRYANACLACEDLGQFGG